jgi:hypothetical protein
MIRARCESAIDWAELDHRFGRMGLGKVLATYLEFAKALLGQPAPRFSHAARAGALTKLRWTIEPSRWRPWGGLAILAIEYAAKRRRDPRGALNLFRWRTWPNRIRRVMKAFKPNSPSW